MDNNDFFDNNGKNENPADNASDEDIFAEETVVEDDSQAAEDHTDEAGQTEDKTSSQNANAYGTDDRRQQTWNQNRVNPDQWQAYRHGQQGPYQQNGYGSQNQWNRQYGQQNPYGNQYGPQGSYQGYGYNGYYQPDNSKGLGIASLVLGILSLLCFCSFLNLLPAVLAIVFGIISLSRRKDNAYAIAGIVCAAVSIALLIITVILFAGNIDLMNALQNYIDNYSNGFSYYFR